MQSSEEQIPEIPEEQKEAFLRYQERQQFKTDLLSELTPYQREVFEQLLEEKEEELTYSFAQENWIAFLKFVREQAVKRTDSEESRQ